MCILTELKIDTRITRRKSFCETSFQAGMDLKEVQKEGKDERTQEDYPTSAKIHSRCRVVFLRSFIFALFLSFFRSIPTLNEVLQKLFANFCSFCGVYKPTSK